MAAGRWAAHRGGRPSPPRAVASAIVRRGVTSAAVVAASAIGRRRAADFGGGGGGFGAPRQGGFGGGGGGFGAPRQAGGFGGGGGGFGAPRQGGFGGGGGGFGDRPQPRRDFGDRDAGGPTYAVSGTVKWFDQVRGFGFVTPEDGGQDVFLHSSVLQKAGRQDVQQGEKVALDVRDGQRGRQAVNLKE